MKIARPSGFFLFGFFMVALAPFVAANANVMDITYFTISPNDPDVNNLCCGTYNNEVLSTLGPHGLPLLNPAYSGAMPTDVNSSGELTWWSPAFNPYVTETGTGTTTLPFDVTSNFFPPNGTGSSDANGYQSAILFGNLNVPTTELISFSIGADDSAFAYLDGNVVCDLGGVHAYTPGTCVTPFNISAGSHTLQVFFDDLNAVQSGLYFDVTTQGVTTTPSVPVPEPPSLALLGLGLGGVSICRRRKTS